LTIEFAKYIVNQVLFPNEQIRGMLFGIEKEEIVISFEDKRHSEIIFSDNN